MGEPNGSQCRMDESSSKFVSCHAVQVTHVVLSRGKKIYDVDLYKWVEKFLSHLFIYDDDISVV